jgi:hypothetical protein
MAKYDVIAVLSRATRIQRELPLRNTRREFPLFTLELEILISSYLGLLLSNVVWLSICPPCHGETSSECFQIRPKIAKRTLAKSRDSSLVIVRWSLDNDDYKAIGV